MAHHLQNVDISSNTNFDEERKFRIGMYGSIS